MTERRGNVAKSAGRAAGRSRCVPDAIATPVTSQRAARPERHLARWTDLGALLRLRSRLRLRLRLRLRTVVVASALMVGLAGCTGTPAPAPSSPGGAGPTVTTSPTTAPPIPSPSASPSPATVAAPERPVAMDRDDAEGAIAAATYFISLYPYAYASGDLTGWQAMSAPGCAFCTSVVGNVSEMTDLGHTSEGPTVSVSSARNGPPTDTPGSFAIELLADQGSSIERDHTGAIVDRVDESKSLSLVAALQHGEDGWIVREVQVDEVLADG